MAELDVGVVDVGEVDADDIKLVNDVLNLDTDDIKVETELEEELNGITLDFFKNKAKTVKFIARLKDKLNMYHTLTSSKLNRSMFNSSNKPSEEEWKNILNELERVGLIKKVINRKRNIISLNK